jgi:O-antigen ligase
MKQKFRAFFISFRPPQSFLTIPVAVFLYVCLLSALLSNTPAYALRGFITKTLEWFVIYFLVLEFFSTKRHILIALSIFLFSAVSVCADSLSQLYITEKDIFCSNVSAGRATACFSTGNDLGGYLLFFLPLSASFFLIQKDNKAKKICFGLIVLLALWVLVMTLSRGAWIASMFAAITFLFLRKRFFAYLLILILIVVAIDFFIILPLNAKQKMRITSHEVSSMVDWRKDLWVDSIKMIKDRPLWGHGPNTFMKVFQKESYRRRVGGIGEYSPSYAHNCYVQMAAEVGLVGLGGFLWILGRFFKNIFRVIEERKKSNEEDPLVILLIGLTAGAVAFLIHSFVDTHLYSLKLSTLFWVMAGLAVSLYKLLSRPSICDIK